MSEMANHSEQPAMPSAEQVMEALKTVQDPEIRHDIVSLGLVYGVDLDREKRSVRIRMTLTTPCCPFAPHLIQQARMRALALPGVEDAQVDIVWEPPWDPKTMASDQVKDALGLW